MKYASLPYYSQYDEIIPEAWRAKVCGLVCIKMILEVFGEVAEMDTPYIDVPLLIKEGLAIDGFTDKNGWDHECLIRLLRNHGVLAYRQEFYGGVFDEKTETIQVDISEDAILFDAGLLKLTETLMEGRPVIVSVAPKFDENTHSHLIVLTGFEGDPEAPTDFYYHDPDARPDTAGNITPKTNMKVGIERFKTFWLKRAIFIETV